MKIGRIKRFPRFNNRKLVSELKKGFKERGVDSKRYKDHPELNLFKKEEYCPDSWIGCRFAFPHTDSHFGDFKFLTLVVKGDGFIFGSEEYLEEYLVPVGTLFVVDARKSHWLYERDWKTNKFFVAVQWLIPYDEFDERSKEIIENLKGFQSEN